MKFSIIILLLVIGKISIAQPVAGKNKITKDRNEIALAMERSMRLELLDKYYPLFRDTLYGGFLTTFTYDFKPTDNQNKMIVTQARHTWVNAKAAMRYPGDLYFRSGAMAGYHFLADKMWDKKYGGFYSLVSRSGEPLNMEGYKEAYGNAFGIYALSAVYELTGDTNVLALAKTAFYWLEQHSHDPVYKGYFQHLHRDGTPVSRPSDINPNAETGYKDQNSSIHLLEALTSLYEVWKDDLVRERLQEMLLLIRDKIVTPKGNLTLFFQPDWTPVSVHDSARAYILKHHNLDYVSFGHDIETAYLMLEASHALGIKNDTTTLSIGKKMVDHALKTGWDKSLGGFYDEGFYFKGEDTMSILKKSKNWWAQAEALNSLLLMSEYFPNDANDYFGKFKKQWKYVETYIIDHRYGDWYEEGLDQEPERRTALKAHMWKATYHNYRALSNCVDRLSQLSGK
jgi:cellobiose epimerase